MRRVLLSACALLAATCAQAQTLRVTVEGAVSAPGLQRHVDGARLSDAVIAAMPTDSAYPTGAVLTRQSAQQTQIRLKAGLLHDLEALALSRDASLSRQAERLADHIDALPVTGRVVTELAPRRLEASPASNLPLMDGDHLYYPLRPSQVSVVGAVDAPCLLAYVALQNASDYLQHCPVQGGDPDWLFAVQPDGTVHRIGIALWNRSEPVSLAPGATLYVPLPERALRALSGDFNTEFAQFLATQRSDMTGQTP